MKKEKFLESLKDLTPQELNKIIEENGKPRRLRNVVFYLTANK